MSLNMDKSRKFGRDVSAENLRGIWDSMEMDKSKYERSAEDCAALTLPTLFPYFEHDPLTEFPEPVDGFGARAVNTLASRIVQLLFPSTVPFFKLKLPDEVVAEFKQIDEQNKQENPKADSILDEVNNVLSARERLITELHSKMQIVSKAYSGMRLSAVTGNHLLWLTDGDGNTPDATVLNLRNYSVTRDPSGKIVELIIKQPQCVDTLMPQYKNLLGDKEDEAILWTYCYRESSDKVSYKSFQSLNEHKIPNSDKTYTDRDFPFIVPPWSLLDGENYSVGIVGENIGDFRSLEALTQSMIEIASQAATQILAVKPSGVTDPVDIKNANNGEVISGDEADVGLIRFVEIGDVQFALKMRDDIIQSLSQAFLMFSSVQRDAERVTAEEIRTMINELEATLGGLFSRLSEDYQLPILRWMVSYLERKGKLPKFPASKNNLIEPIITAGYETLGRTSEFTRMAQAIQLLGSVLGDRGISWLKERPIVIKAFTSQSVDARDLVKTEQERMQEQAEAMQLQMAQFSAQEAVKQGGNNGGNQGG